MSSFPCPRCGGNDVGIYDSRPHTLYDIPTIRRRRNCGNCAHRWSTFEIHETTLKALDERASRIAQPLNSAIQKFISELEKLLK